MEPYQKAFIELALEYQALRFGEFKLKSGRISPYFFNVGQLNTGKALKILSECYASAIHQANLPFDVLFGPAYKGIPLVCTTASALYQQYEHDVPYAFNRKEAKDHGEGGLIIGAPLKGRILIIDDVITAGTAMREAIQHIETAGGTVAGIIVALDRQEKGQGELSAIQEIEDSLAIPVHTIITFNHIFEFVAQQPHFHEYQEPLNAYREKYGVKTEKV